MERYFNDRLIFFKYEKRAIYYTDMNKRYKFNTNNFGFNLLLDLTKIVKRMLELNKKLIEDKGLKYDKILKRGKYIYTSKSSLKTSSITWSEDEYNNYGLQAYYLKLKSFQRFVESWSLLERCDNLKPPLFIERNNLVICSIGGGPGFECIAFEKFYKMKYPNLKLSFYILDIIEPWGNYVNIIGSNYKFIKFDIFKDNLFEKVPNVDFILLFNVMHNYMLNDKGLDIINNYLTKAHAILINDRGRNINKRNIEEKNINIINIFIDDRQMVLSKKKFNMSTSNILTFPNNPYIN